MKTLAALRQDGRTMKRKLFRYMLLLAAVLVVTLVSGLFLFGRFSSTQQEMADALGLQMEFFSKEVTQCCEDTAALSLSLSRQMGNTIDFLMKAQNMTFSHLTNDGEALSVLQEAMIDPLRQTLMQADCSGIFVMLNATVNDSVPDAALSRSGLYLQKSEAQASSENVLLYRGIAEIGKQHGVMPHRKWRLEFRTDLFPSVRTLLPPDETPLEKAYGLTELITLPGTSERAALMTLPVRGASGEIYGLCGFELSQSYFQHHFSQPTLLSYLTCIVSPSGEAIDSERSFSCGVEGGYYFAPTGLLTPAALGKGMDEITGGSISYIGLRRSVQLSPLNEPFTLAVLTPKSEYDRAVLNSTVQTVLLTLLLLFFTVSSCIYFTKKFLAPVLRGLEQLKTPAHEESSGFQEIDDLFGFLADKDRAHEETLRALEQEMQEAQTRATEVQSDFDSAQTELERLAYARSREIDPDKYSQFLDGIHRLTPTEQEIFNDYLSGLSVKEILEIAGIKESTLRYHNRNIYSKLGVGSRKQLLRYAALMQWQNEEKAHAEQKSETEANASPAETPSPDEA